MGPGLASPVGLLQAPAEPQLRPGRAAWRSTAGPGSGSRPSIDATTCPFCTTGAHGTEHLGVVCGIHGGGRARDFFRTLRLEPLGGHPRASRHELALAVFERIERWHDPSKRHSLIRMLGSVDHGARHAPGAAAARSPQPTRPPDRGSSIGLDSPLLLRPGRGSASQWLVASLHYPGATGPRRQERRGPVTNWLRRSGGCCSPCTANRPGSRHGSCHDGRSSRSRRWRRCCRRSSPRRSPPARGAGRCTRPYRCRRR